VSPDGRIVQDAFHAEPSRWVAPLYEPFMGSAGADPLVETDEALGPLATRAEVRDATDRPVADCEPVSEGLLLQCSAAVRANDGSVVHVTRRTQRVVRSLYEERFQLAAISVVVLGIGTLLALFLGRWMVGPIEQLRDQVVARTRGPVSTEPVVLDRRDELGDLALAFNQLLAALEARNRANAVFAADLAHELKNPVGAVMAAAEAMAADRPVEGERKERLQRVLADASARLSFVVDRFLELARAEAGLLESQREDVDVARLAAALVDAKRADPRWADRTFTLSGTAPPVPAVAERLETALRNLLANAAHFAGPGGTVTVEIREDAGAVELAVADTGPGIAAEDLPRIFDRYRSTREGGTGLGLALTKAIVEAHGGTIEARSRDGGGAVFVVRLPARAGGPPPPTGEGRAGGTPAPTEPAATATRGASPR
jgi:signal transduction histidine kinase